MIRTILGAALALCALASAADARIIRCNDRGCDDRPVFVQQQAALPKVQRMRRIVPVWQPMGGVERPAPAARAASVRRPDRPARVAAARYDAAAQPAYSPVAASLPAAPIRAVARAAEAVADAIAAPVRFVRGRLICADNVNAALAERGIRGTGSRLAKSFLGWGRASGPVPGAVAVYHRRGGGHVAIVSHVDANGRVWVWNPSARRQAWQLAPYGKSAIAYRVAG